MDRREALKALLALPATATLTRAEVKPTDVLVIECGELLSDSQCKHIKASIQQAFGEDQRVLVLGREMKLKVVSFDGDIHQHKDRALFDRLASAPGARRQPLILPGRDDLA